MPTNTSANSILNRFSLSGKTAVVTGGAGLYGRQIVRAIAQAGATTYMASRDVQSLQDLASQYREEELDVHALSLDLASESSILNLHQAVLDRSGAVDVLINNAVARPMMEGFHADAHLFDQSMHINATGLFIISRAFADTMAERGSGGSIINIASIQGMIAPDPVLYEGTDMAGYIPDYFFHKAGMIQFTRFLASYYGPRGGIRCNAVSPGGYGEDAHPTHLEQYNRRTCLQRRANDTDLMGAIVFLASDASQYITGTNLPVDGGYTAM